MRFKLNVFLVLITAAFSFSSRAQLSVDRVGVIKLIINRQTSPTAVSPDIFMVTGFIEGGTSSSFPSGPRTLTGPNNHVHDFVFEGDGWFAEAEFATKAALDTAFPDGNYTIRAGGASVTVSLVGGSYPVAPIATVNAGTWTNGRLAVTESEAASGFTISSSRSNGNGFTTLEIWSDEDSFEMFRAVETGFSAISAQVPAGALKLGKRYTVGLAFDHVVDSRDFPLNAGARAYALYSSETEFEVEVVPNPVAVTPVTVSAALEKNAEGQLLITLRWTSATAHRYVLESSSDMATWTAVGRAGSTVAGQNSRSLLVGSSGKLFYRLRAL